MGVGALIGGSLASTVVGGVLSGKAANAQANAANKAAELQLQGVREANALQREMYYDSRGLQEPWRVTGQNALAAMAGLVGVQPFMGQPNTAAPPLPAGNVNTPPPGNINTAPVGGTSLPEGVRSAGVDDFGQPVYVDANGNRVSAPMAAPAPNPTPTTPPPAATNPLAAMAPAGNNGDPYAAFRNTPGYGFMQEEGNKAIERMASARGLRLSGGTLKEGARFNSGLADMTFGDHFNRLGVLAGVGQSATNNASALGQNFANQSGANIMQGNALAGQGYMQAGQARASGYAGINNAIQAGANNLFQIYGLRQAGMI